MSTNLKEDVLKAVAEGKCNTCALSHACNNYDEHHCKENGFSRYEPIEIIRTSSLVNKLKRRLKRTEERCSILKSKEKDLNDHGKWELGYWQGQIAILEDCIDELEEVK